MKDKIKQALNINRGKKDVIIPKYNITSVIQVAKIGSEHFFDHVALYEAQDKSERGLLLYNTGHLPTSTDLYFAELNKGCGKFKKQILNTFDYDLIEQAINFCKDNQGLDMNPYTMLVTYCLMHTFDIRKLLD